MACDVIANGLRPIFAGDDGPLFFQRPTAEAGRVELWTAGRDGRGARKLRDVGGLAPMSYTFSASPHQRIAWTEFRAGRQELWRLTLDEPQ